MAVEIESQVEKVVVVTSTGRSNFVKKVEIGQPVRTVSAGSSSITNLGGVNEYILDNVQGDFLTGVGKSIQYIAGAGATDLNGQAGGNVFLSGSPVDTTDGLHIRVNQKNHGMHTNQDVVTFTDIQSDVTPTKLAADYDSASTGSIIVNDGTEFA